jgi:glycosyltransferase involved in cell wall biosynthesis
MENDLKRGEAIFAEGKFEEAEEFFSRLLVKDPTNAEILNNLGVICHARNDIVKAENYFLKAFDAQDDYLDALLNLVSLYQETKRWKDAAVQLEKCISLNSSDLNCYILLGQVYLEMDNSTKARMALTRALELDPNQDKVREVLESLENSKAPSSPPVRTDRYSPSVCIGLPVYNGGEMLSGAIESILSQDFENFELIISDNCSTDNTMETCLKYQKKDKRIKYYRLEENLGGKNFPIVFARSNSPYFMWAAHDDLHERSFISKCLERIEQDPSIALVYPKTRVLDADSNFIHIAEDYINTDQDNPIERFRHLIWEIGACHMFYGLYRTRMIKKVHLWRNTLIGVDNVALAEIALLGKIVQINDVLFTRRLTRNYNHRTLDEYYVHLMDSCFPERLLDGITLPHCRFTYTNLELLKYLEIESSEMNFLINDVLKCFKTRFGAKIQYEIDRAVRLINDGYIYYTWDGKRRHTWRSDDLSSTDYFHINNLLVNLREALFIYPERSDLKDVFDICLKEAYGCATILP